MKGLVSAPQGPGVTAPAVPGNGCGFKSSAYARYLFFPARSLATENTERVKTIPHPITRNM